MISLREDLASCVEDLGVELPVRTYPEANNVYDACLSRVSRASVSEAEELWRDGRDERVTAAFGKWAQAGYPHFQLGLSGDEAPDNPFR